MSGNVDSTDALQQELARLRRSQAQLREALSDQRRQHELLLEIGRAPGLPRLLDILHGEIERFDAFDGYLVNLAELAGDGLMCARARMPDSHAGMEDVYTNFRFELQDDDPMVAVYRSGRRVQLDAAEAAGLAGPTGRGFERWAASAMAILPIACASGPVGTLAGFRQLGEMEPAAIEAIEACLRLLGDPIRNAIAMERLRQKEAQVQAALEDHRRFLRFVSEVNRLSSPQTLYAAILDEFLTAFRFDLGFLSLAEADGLVTKHVGARDAAHAEHRQRLQQLVAEPLSVKRSGGANAIAFLQNSPILIVDARAIRNIAMAELDRRALERLRDVRTVLHMPIRQQGEAIGMLGLFSLEQPRPLAAGELEMIELLAAFVGTTLVNAQLYHLIGGQKGQIEALNRELRGKIQLLDEMVQRDPLTGLHNFGAFRSELGRRTAEFNRRAGDGGLALVIVDVDHFKGFNDSYGHLAGNVVLQELANRIGGAARGMDIPCRFGGEEFAVILPRCGLDGAAQFGERLRALVAETPFGVNGKLLEVTISVGCASLAAGEAMEDFLERADAALYRAKENGPNRVELARPDQPPYKAG